ncbi:hypothetical protein AB0C29_00545 [Actinoplanes sp. NPDC048791]|uniref:hypothetical protein n=1 Tax=Actinoplanes sp. NPDC048791 TaxID=3154623 RepID=UPI0033EBD384
MDSSAAGIDATPIEPDAQLLFVSRYSPVPRRSAVLGVLSSGLCAIPAVVDGALFVTAATGGRDRVLGVPAALCAATVSFLIHVVGPCFGLDARNPPRMGHEGKATSSSDGD